MSKATFTAKYLARAAAGVPRDLVNSVIAATIKPIRPTVLIYNCTFVCDARCEMCNNWKRGDRKSDMTLEQLDGAMNHPFWGAVENLNISGGEPTTRNDLPELTELLIRRLPRVRKVGINTTGLTPHRAIPQLTRIVEFCAARDLPISVRVSLDGIGEIHDQVRQVKRGFDKAGETIAAMEALARKHDQFQFGIAATIFATNMQDAKNILGWARERVAFGKPIIEHPLMTETLLDMASEQRAALHWAFRGVALLDRVARASAGRRRGSSSGSPSRRTRWPPSGSPPSSPPAGGARPVSSCCSPCSSPPCRRRPRSGSTSPAGAQPGTPSGSSPSRTPKGGSTSEPGCAAT